MNTYLVVYAYLVVYLVFHRLPLVDLRNVLLPTGDDLPDLSLDFVELLLRLDHVLRGVALGIAVVDGAFQWIQSLQLAHATRDILILLGHVLRDALLLGQLPLQRVERVVDVLGQLRLLKQGWVLGRGRWQDQRIHGSP